ncbi:phospho-sugar mutase [Granulicoccus sp. GXG6511]|uniref:phospho-sugar mutase n=1 Tax=Granulicoccus sp. GXG6511 TaxID=3381351 RepID=UPI003D7C5C83
MTVTPEALAAAKKWRSQDPDPDTKAELAALLERAEAGDQAAGAELNDSFSGMLEFGTAGLRGKLGPGPNRMNRLMVAYAAAGVGSYLKQLALFGNVLIGYDARHKSADFARESAEIIGGLGFHSMLTSEPMPTPVIAFGIKHLDCNAGIVVTASHNPPADNGYKVYLGDGVQIVAPHDERIAAGLLRTSKKPLFMLHRSTDHHMIGEELVEAYLERVARLVGNAGPRNLSWVHTALHGVGAKVVRQVADRLGFAPPLEVAAQAEPDPDFPTVAFPNPEEPGALDLAMALAQERGADLIVANDPDADRCAVAIPDGLGDWRMLHGNELGILLGDYLARRGVTGVYATTIVSGTMLAKIAAAHGQRSALTLTGFKWIARVPELAYGYEEALGYCCDPEGVSDKDGISAAALVLAMAAEEKAAGRTLADRLDQLALEHGVHLSDQLSVRVEDLTVIATAMARLRAEPPAELCGEPIAVVDYAEGVDGLPLTDAIQLRGETVTATVRPSGTEPKLKCYFETRVAPEVTARDLAGSKSEAAGLMVRLKEDVQAALGL